METGFFEIAVGMYKILAGCFTGFVAFCSIVLPMAISVSEETPVPLLLYLGTPLVLAACFAIMNWLF